MQQDDKWGAQFSSSLRQYYALRAAGPDGTLRTAIQRSIATTAGFTTLSPSTAAAFIKALAEQYIRFETVSLIDDLQTACESPIELAMALALWVAAREEADAVQCILGSKTHGVDTGGSRIVIQPQAIIEPYRVDFLLTARCQTPPARLLPAHTIVPPVERQMVLECDGREFHDAHLSQAIRDRQRDRDLQARGHLVFRYAGAEIWADVFMCARQAVEALINPMSIGQSA